MKKIIRVLTLTLAFAVLCGSFATTAYAKILYQCHCCGGDGIYTCDAVDCKDGKLPCGRCNSTGQTIEMCGDCNGTGKCRLCQGTGKRLGDDTIDCDNCNGTGQCQGGPGWGPCTQGQYYNQCPDCTGERVVWHDNEWCIYARNHDGQCPSCKGTGYEGEGGEGTPNDGVSNVPRAGDAIYYLNGSYAIYGGGYSGGENGSNGNGTTSTPSENTTQPPATTDPGPSQTDPPQQNDNPPDQSENNQPGTDFPPADMTLLPENRNSDFDIPLSNEPDRTITSSVRVEMGKMTDEEQKYYAGLPEEELAQILTNVRTIVASAEPGRSDSKTDELLNSLATQNGYGSLPEGRLFPLYFEGHQEIGFPVHVTVSVEKGLLDGGTDLYVYHIAEDGIIELLGKAEYGTYEDGTIENISFYTSSFSTFFTSAKELDTDISVVTGDSESTDAMGSTGENETPLRFWIVLFAVMTSVIAVVIVGTIVVRKKRKKE